MKILFQGLVLLSLISFSSGCHQPELETKGAESSQEAETHSELTLPTQEEVIEAVIFYRKEHQQVIDSAEYVYQVTYDEETREYLVEVGENHTDQIVVVGRYRYVVAQERVLEQNDK